MIVLFSPYTLTESLYTNDRLARFLTIIVNTSRRVNIGICAIMKWCQRVPWQRRGYETDSAISLDVTREKKFQKVFKIITVTDKTSKSAWNRTNHWWLCYNVLHCMHHLTQTIFAWTSHIRKSTSRRSRCYRI